MSEATVVSPDGDGTGFASTSARHIVTIYGVILGPTALGAIWPQASEFVFNDDVLPFVDVFAQTTDVSRAVVDVAAERSVDTVVLSSRRAFSAGALRTGTIGGILSGLTCDVLVLVDPAGRGTSPRPHGQILVPFQEPAELTMRVARQLARTHGASVRLVAASSDLEAATRLAARHADSAGSILLIDASTEVTPGDLLSAGDDADLIVVPVDGTTSDDGNGRTWSTTPVLAIRDRSSRMDRGTRTETGLDEVEETLA